MGSAQEFAATVESNGRATVAAQPERVEFVLKFRVRGETFEEAVTKAEPLEEKLREALDDFEPAALDIALGAIQIRSLSPPQVYQDAVVRFPIQRRTSGKDRATAFAKLCDRINTVASELSADVRSPVLGVDNPESFEQETVQRATENALYRADAIAAIMKSQIFAVQSVTISDVRWIHSTEDPETAPNLDRLVCAARVNVVYSLAPR
jgi:uncharacterized protein YggE